ncbi:helix-turn-helix domain-containing protein [Quadrisphaera granulorum]|uniref:helix-turn-helix domain-containing protein n=1 Tax=Quadrisphaera granulorum TaxID=317664 RepID=UPI001B8861C9|nr:helix-turn-helix domain-containing protein [Quadrisphaera granulorum]
MGPSLASVRALPEWRSAVVLAGDPAGVPLSRVVLLDSPDELGTAAAVDALVVLAGPSWRTAPAWRLDAVLRRAADAGARAALLAGTEPLPGPTRLLCTRLDLCVVGAGGPLLDLAASAAVHLAAPEVAAARAVLTVSRAVAEGRVTAPGPLVDLCSQLLAVPVALTDASGAVLHGDPSLVVPRPDTPVPQRERGSDGAGNATTGETTVARPVLLAGLLPGLRSVQRWLVARVPTSAVVVTDDVLAAASTAVAGWLAADRTAVERDARGRAALLTDVLRLTGEPSPELRQRAAAAGWPMAGWHVGVRVRTGNTTDVAGLRHEALRCASEAGLQLVVAEHGDGWSGWWSSDRSPSAVEVRHLAERFRRLHNALRHITGCATGVGRPHQGPAGIARTLSEATDAALLAAGRPEQGRFLHVDQLGVAQTLLAWTRTETFEPAARSLLEPLLSDPSLVQTLRVYLDAESSLSETATTLGIHRNTAAQRVARIERLLGVSLNDHEQRLALQLACRAVGPRT